ncbi:hypothetical protein BH23ACT10_BH23ACT10_32520 [soil metagenome]
MSALRVVMVQGAAERAGAEVVLLGRATNLRRFGVEPIVAFLADGPFVEEARAHDIDVEVLADAPARVRHPWQVPGQVRALARFAHARGADIIEGCGEKMSIWSGHASRMAGLASVFQLHDGPLRSGPTSVTQLAMAAAPREVAVVPSRWMAAAFRRRLGLSTVVVPNGLMLDSLPDGAVDVRSEFGWSPQHTVIAMPGRLESWKGHHVFLRAAATVARRDPSARFLIVGGALYGRDRAYADRLPRLAAELGIAHATVFTGHRTDALQLMADADVVCHCSTAPEPFGMVLIEAMALRTAVIATRGGGPDEIVDDGHTGLLVDPGDHEQLAAAMTRVLADDGVRSRMIDAAERRVRESYSAEAMARSMAAVYRRAVEAQAA